MPMCLQLWMEELVAGQRRVVGRVLNTMGYGWAFVIFPELASNRFSSVCLFKLGGGGGINKNNIRRGMNIEVIK